MANMLFGLLGRKRKKQYEIPPNSEGSGFFHMVWERKKLPSPGAQNYAYESLALAPVSPISAAVRVRNPRVRAQAGMQPFAAQRGLLIGVPIVAGNVVGQGLFNPAEGFTGTWPIQSTNIAFPKHEIQPAGYAL